MIRILVASLVTLTLSASTPAQQVSARTSTAPVKSSAAPVEGSTTPAESSTTKTRFYPLESVKVGQHGTGRTVFAGTEPQEFNVEVLGVLQGFPAPRQSAIIARLSGANVERTGVFAGMSGSPVYIDGQLVGAIAFAFPFAKEPIAGITPIKQMIEIFERGASTQQPASSRAAKEIAREPRAVSFAKLAATEWQSEWPKPPFTAAAPFIAPVAGGSPLAALLGQQLAPIATPLVFSGIAAETLALFAPQLQANGLVPVSGIGGTAPITPLVKATDKTLLPGASVSVQLVRGDYSMAAAGTVTLRDGNQIYAFGHPFLGLGSADMPMAEASVVSVIPNTLSSFKLAAPGAMVGAISQDRSTGIFGRLGAAPKMISVTVQVHTSRDRTERYTYEVAYDKFLSPLLLNLTIYNTIASTERSLGDATISVQGQINLKGQDAIRLEQKFSSMTAARNAAGAVAVPVGALLTSGFDDVEINGITLDVTSLDSKATAVLDRIAIDRIEVGRGESIEVQAYMRTESGKQFVQRIPVTIPADVPLGQLLLFVGDGGALQQASAAQAFVPKDLGQLVSTINKIKKSDRLYVKLFRLTAGAVIGTDELPNLPPSVVATLNSERSAGGHTPTVLSPVYEKELPPAEYVVAGQQLIAINIVR